MYSISEFNIREDEDDPQVSLINNHPHLLILWFMEMSALLSVNKL